MATSTYTAIASITLGSSASSVTFSSIDQSYRDLVLVFSGTASGNGDILLSFNGDTTNTYSNVQIFNSGSTPLNADFSRPGMFAVYGRNYRFGFISQLMEYSATDKHTTGITRGISPLDQTIATISRYPQLTAISSISVSASGQTLSSGCTFALYGIEA